MGLPADPFPSTRHSLVQHIGVGGAEGRAALDRFCAVYWPCVYEFIRRRRERFGRDDAEDLTQGFFAELVDRNDLASVSRERGKLRAYLVTAIRNYVANADRSAGAQKRGGRAPVVALDDATIGRIERELEEDPDTSPEAALERRMLDRVLAAAREQLHQEWIDKQWGERWEVVHHLLSQSPERGEFRRIAADLGLDEVNARQLVHRLRKRYERIVAYLLHERGAEQATLGGGVDQR